jgi:hypothetical protein
LTGPQSDCLAPHSHLLLPQSPHHNYRQLATVKPAIALTYDIDSSIKVCSSGTISLVSANGNYTAADFTSKYGRTGIVYASTPDLYAANSGLLCKPFKAKCKDYKKTLVLGATTRGDPVNLFCMQVYPDCPGTGVRTYMNLTAVTPSLTQTFTVNCRKVLQETHLCLESNERIQGVEIVSTFKNYNIIQTASSCGAAVVNV